MLCVYECDVNSRRDRLTVRGAESHFIIAFEGREE